jgi:hypothetical protein
MIQLGSQHLDTVRKNETALELPRGDATVQKGFVNRTVQPAANDQLIVFDGDAEILGGKPCNRERDPQSFVVRMFDIVGRIGLRLGVPFEQSFDMLEAQKKRAVEKRMVHFKALLGGFAGPSWAAGYL